jgi:hypothetical protein
MAARLGACLIAPDCHECGSCASWFKWQEFADGAQNQISMALPKDFALIYTYKNGTVPPPYHYEVAIRILPGKPAVYEFRPGYPGLETGAGVWKETFPLSDAEREALLKQLLSRGLNRTWKTLASPPVGGGSATLKVTAGGRTVSVPSFPRAPDDTVAQMLFVTAESAVPIALRKKLKARFDALSKSKQPGIR